jgi:hypothetical protein
MNEQYFYVLYRSKLSFSFLNGSFELPDYEEFEQDLPALAQISGLMDPLDRSSIKALHKYGREFSRLADKQTEMAKRINQILSYIIETETGELAYTTTMISGSGFKFNLPSSKTLIPNSLIKFRLAMPEFAMFISGYAELKEFCQDPASPGFNTVKAEFIMIRDSDREALIRAVTLIQQKELRIRAEKKAEL